MLAARTILRGLVLAVLSAPHIAFAQDQPAVNNVPPQPGYEDIAERLSETIVTEMEAHQLPAFSIALVDGGQVVWAHGFGFCDVEGTRAADAATVYRVGSISKLMTDLAVMQLVEQEKIDLDAPVTDLVPTFQPRNPFDKPITLRQLMSHRSGLVRESPVGSYFDPDEPTLAETIESLNSTTLVYPPGTRTKYSNAGIALVGLALERAAGKPFAEQLQAALFGPLGMSRSRFTRDETDANIADGQMWTYDRRRFPAPPFELAMAPAGNLYSSVLDLSKFAIAILNDGAGEQGRILKPETVQQMLTLQSSDANEPRRFGIGFAIDEFEETKLAGHGGAVYGFSTQLAILPEHDIAMAAVCSMDGTNGLVRRIQDRALRMLLAKRQLAKTEPWQIAVSIPVELARSLDGTFRTGDQEIRIDEEEGRLFLNQREFRRELLSMANDFLVDDLFGLGITIKRLNADTLEIDGKPYQRVSVSIPAECPENLKEIVGEYGWDHNVLYLYEERGQLRALIEWFYDYPLTQLSENEFAFPEDYGLYHGEKVIVHRAADGSVTEVVAADVTFARREVGTKNGETFKIDPIKPIDELRKIAMEAKPPQEIDFHRKSELTELIALDPTLKLDIRYATDNNFMGEVFYRQPRAFLQKPAAEAVVKVHRRLREEGLGLLIHDAYRPWYVTKMFYEATPDELKDFVANPANGSRHNRGCAVDLTLFELKTGTPIEMVAGYDEFSPRSFPYYPGGTARQRWYRKVLRQAMEAEGFTIYEFEWWHFDHQDWRQYSIGNVTFEEIGK